MKCALSAILYYFPKKKRTYFGKVSSLGFAWEKVSTHYVPKNHIVMNDTGFKYALNSLVFAHYIFFSCCLVPLLLCIQIHVVPKIT